MLRRFLRAGCLLIAAVAPALALPKWQQFPIPPPMPSADESGFAEVRGISMFYSVYGKGKGSPILLIHGGMSSSDVWSFEVPTLAESHEVIVADSRGQGRSTHGLAWLTYHRMAEDYVALLAKLNIDRVSLVGWSDGGIIGIDIAMHHPKLLDRLFAQAPNVTPDGLTSIPEIDPPPLSESLSVSGEDPPDPVTKARSKQLARERVFRRLWATEPNYSDGDLAKIHVPTEIVIGDHDPVIRPGHAAHIARTIPGARLVVLKDVGHPAHSQDPKQYLKAIQDFMAAEPPVAATGAPAPKASQPPAAVAQSQAKAAPKPSAALLLPPAAAGSQVPSVATSQTAGLSSQGTVQ